MQKRREFLLSSGLRGAASRAAGAHGFDLLARTRPGKADGYLLEAPSTITAARSEQSAGGLHDEFSEGDYRWPDPKDPDGPYIQRSIAVRLSVQAPALCAAWMLTGERQ